MAFRRGARPSWYFTGKTRTGWEQLCTFSKDRRLAEKVEGAWAELAEDHRAWDVIDRVLAGEMNAAELYDLWRSARVNRSLAALRQQLADADLDPIVAEFLDLYGKKFPDAVGHVRSHVRYLIPDGTPFFASRATGDYLLTRLYEHGVLRGKKGTWRPSAQNTLRKVHANWSSFFTYATEIKKLYAASPMREVARPPAKRPPVKFYDLASIQRIIGWQESAEKRAVLALMYGAAIEVSLALDVTRADLDPVTQELRAPGEKALMRDRVCRLETWAWDLVWAHARHTHPTAHLFPREWTRFRVYDWHADAITALGLPYIKPYASRHAWAARWLRAGSPVEVVQKQLGHSSPNLTLALYGQFRPGASDRAEWEAKVLARETQQQEADRAES